MKIPGIWLICQDLSWGTPRFSRQGSIGRVALPRDFQEGIVKTKRVGLLALLVMLAEPAFSQILFPASRTGPGGLWNSPSGSRFFAPRQLLPGPPGWVRGNLFFRNPAFSRPGFFFHNRGFRRPGSFLVGSPWLSFQTKEDWGQFDGASPFVSQWEHQDPISRAAHDSLSQSMLLKPGMAPDEVIQVLGSPLSRDRFEQREIWRYSGYSLIFEAQRLKGLR
jgi:hypothetical protein